MINTYPVDGMQIEMHPRSQQDMAGHIAEHVVLINAKTKQLLGYVYRSKGCATWHCGASAALEFADMYAAIRTQTIRRSAAYA
jgi:hypothetical protein